MKSSSQQSARQLEKIFRLSLLASFALVTSAHAASFTVTVNGAGCAANAQVVAVVQGSQGPDSTKSVVTTADGSGIATFSGLTTSDAYQFMAANAGCTPSMRDQSMSPSNGPQSITDGGTKAISLTSGNSDATVNMTVKLPAGGSFPKLVTGSCNVASNNVQASFGISSFAGQTGTLTFYNLRPGPANTYNCNVFSAEDNRGSGAPVNTTLTPTQNFTIPGTIDLTQSFAPPPSTENQGSRDGSNIGFPNLSVFLKNGVNAAVPMAQLRLKTSPTGNPVQYTQSDMNGVANFYGLDQNTTTFFLDVTAPALQGFVNLEFSTPSWTTTYSTAITLGALTHPGTISGSVRMNGAALPGVWMNCNPDFSPYPGSDTFGGDIPNPGAGNVGGQLSTGTFNFHDLTPGNYNCSVNSPFSQSGTVVTDGADGTHSTTDDIRLTIDNLGIFKVYNAVSGVLISSNTPIVVSIPVNAGADGTISGTLTFPDEADLSLNPVTILAYGQSTPGDNTPPNGGVTVSTGIGQTQLYTLKVPSGHTYFIQAQGITYGPVNLNDSPTADLTLKTSASNLNFTMAKAGSIEVTLATSNGSRWLPVTQPPLGAGSDWFQTGYCGASVNANGQSVRSWNQGSPDQSGVVNIPGLPAGSYNLQFQANGGGCTVTNTVLNNVVVGIGQTTKVTLTVQNGVGVDVHTGALPAGTVVVDTSHGSGHTDGLLLATVVAYPRGTSLTLDTLQSLGNPENNQDPNLQLSLDKSSFNNVLNVASVGFIPGNVGGGQFSAPKVTPGELTFYLFASQKGGPEFHTLLGKANAVVDAAHADVFSTVFGSSAVPVNIASSFGSATITGKVNGSHIMTKDDFVAAGGDENKVFSHIPICAIYDQNASLLGFGTAIPPNLTQAQKDAVDSSFAANDADGFLAALNNIQFSYTVAFLPSGNYNLACTTPNYPPVLSNVTLTDNQTITLDVDFDKSAGAGGTISGTVADSGGVKLAGATVTIRTKTLTKTQTTDSTGAYAFPNLADGIYRMEAAVPGFASATDKSIIENGTPATVNFALVSAPGSITGTVYASVFPSKVAAGGADVYAYDDTVNAARLGPDAPHWTTQTDANGVYTLPNPAPGDVIKIFATTDGKYPAGTQVTATASVVTAPDLSLSAIPPTPTVLYKPLGGATIDLTVRVPKVLAFAPTLACSAGATYTDTGATPYTLVSAPNNVYEASVITMPATVSTCRLITDDGDKAQTIDTLVNLTTVKEQSNSTIRNEAFGGSVESDTDNQGASIDFPMGSIVTASGTLPTVQIVRDASLSVSAAVTQTTIMSDSFELASDANLQLGNGKSLDITLPVSRTTLPDPKSLRLAQIINGQIVPVPGEGFYDALTGRFTVSVNSLGNAPAASSIRMASASPSLKGLAPYKSHSYGFDVARAASQSGSFVLVGVRTATPPGPTNAAYGGATLGAFNFPNPFNLKSKTIGLLDGSSMTTDGTILHYDLPAANAGHVIIRVFSVSGELVRVIDEGVKAGGITYYTAWDGKNMNGADVATGVYFAVFDVPGLKPKQHVVKMAVLK